jgi:hypothetical protein
MASILNHTTAHCQKRIPIGRPSYQQLVTVRLITQKKPIDSKKRVQSAGCFRSDDHRFVNFFPWVGSIAGKHQNRVFQAERASLIYTAFTNLICNKEITYGRDK